MEPLVKYLPCPVRLLTLAVKPARGQRQAGSLTGAVASQKVTEAREGTLAPVGNRRNECKGKRVPDCEADGPGRRESGS